MLEATTIKPGRTMEVQRKVVSELRQIITDEFSDVFNIEGDNVNRLGQSQDDALVVKDDASDERLGLALFKVGNILSKLGSGVFYYNQEGIVHDSPRAPIEG